MSPIEHYCLDILRQLGEIGEGGRFYSVPHLIKRYFPQVIPLKEADKITSLLLASGWVRGVEEDDALMINEAGTVHLARTITPAYIVDRVFEFFKTANSPQLLSQILEKLRFKLDKNEEDVLSAKLERSGLLKVGSFGYHPSFQLNADGRIVLDEFGSYSAYQQRSRVSPSIYSDDLSELSVLKAFYMFEKLSWHELSEKGIFNSLIGGSARALRAGDIINELAQRGYLDRLAGPPPTWRITTTGRSYYETLLYDHDETIISSHMHSYSLPETFELVFQRHKQNQGTLSWHKETLKPNIPDNWLTAREMMIQQGILFVSSNQRIKRTTLHPDVFACMNYQEAVETLVRKSQPVLSNTQHVHAQQITGNIVGQVTGTGHTIEQGKREEPAQEKGVFAKYFMWPLIVGIIVAIVTWILSMLA